MRGATGQDCTRLGALNRSEGKKLIVTLRMNRQKSRPRDERTTGLTTRTCARAVSGVCRDVSRLERERRWDDVKPCKAAMAELPAESALSVLIVMTRSL